MPASNQHIAATELSVIKRRPVGKGAWKMTVVELMESERSDLAKLRRLRNKAGTDNETRDILLDLYEEKCARLISLNELLHYRDTAEPSVNGERS